jgi:hypothetical protein
MFSSEEHQEPDAEVLPQLLLDSPVTRAESPLPDQEDSTKQDTETKTLKAVAKKKPGNQVEVLPGVTIERHTSDPLADDAILLVSW